MLLPAALSGPFQPETVGFRLDIAAFIEKPVEHCYHVSSLWRRDPTGSNNLLPRTREPIAVRLDPMEFGVLVSCSLLVFLLAEAF